jgi:hypothetical protein
LLARGRRMRKSPAHKHDEAKTKQIANRENKPVFFIVLAARTFRKGIGCSFETYVCLANPFEICSNSLPLRQWLHPTSSEFKRAYDIQPTMAVILKLSVAVLALGGVVFAQNTPGVSPGQESPATPEPIHASSEPVHQQKYDPLLDLPPLPENTISLLGGAVTKLDRVRDQLSIRAFGGNVRKVAFDVRTKFYRGATPVQDRELQQGQRIYVDTMLNGTEVFAKNIWIMEGPASGNGAGQVIAYDPGKGMLELRDQLTAETLHFRLDPKTVIKEGDAVRSTNVLVPGALVSLTFSPGQQKHAAVDEVEVLARPGYSVSFFGPVTFLDLSRSSLGVLNRVDGKTYEIRIDGIPSATVRKLHPGAVIGVGAVFDGKQYTARSLGFAATGGSSE